MSFGTSRQPSRLSPSSSSRPVVPGRGQIDRERPRLPAQETIGHLDQNAGPVPRVRLAAAGAAVQQVDQQLQPLLDDSVRTPTLDIHDEADATGVLLVRRVVEALRAGRLSAVWLHNRFSRRFTAPGSSARSRLVTRKRTAGAARL